MVATILMIVGGLLILLSVVGLFLFLIEPLIKNYRIVIKREDDYAHYTSPQNYAMLQNARKNYCIGLLVMFIAGFLMLYAGAFFKYSDRGFGLLFSTRPEGDGETIEDLPDDNIADFINDEGKFEGSDGQEYSHWIIVSGTKIFYKEDYIGDIEAFRSFIADKKFARTIYIKDEYAAASTYHEVFDALEERGFEPKKDETQE